MKIDLQGKVVVITGGGGALCSVFAKALAENGARLALIDIHPELAEKVAEEIMQSGGIARVYQGDVLDAEQIMSVYGKIREELGACDILINGAGSHHPLCTTQHEQLTKEHMTDGSRCFFDLDLETADWLYRLDFMGTFIPTQVISKDMVGREGCSIINLSSMNAVSPTTTVPVYAAAKAGVSNFTYWLANYFAKVGIRVNALAPGFFVTELNRKMLYTSNGEPTGRTKRILEGTPMGRFGDLEECVGTLLYLVDPELSGFVTGTVLPIDGGFCCYSGV